MIFRQLPQHLSGLFHLCLVNSATIPHDVLGSYAQEGAEPLRFDKTACAELGVELVLCPPFESFYNFSPEEFVREILKNCLNCRGVVCGEDYRFGKKGAGNVALLRELAEPMGIAVTALEPVTWKGETVSSSRIRRCLLEGDTELAGELLKGAGADPQAARDAVLHTMACKAAIKGGQKNTREELLVVVREVMAGRVKYCPHGRPVAVTMTRQQLEHQFKRS